MKKILLLLVSLLLISFIVACDSDESEEATPAPTPVTPTPTPDNTANEPIISNYDLGLIGVSFFSLEFPFPLSSYDGVRYAEEEFGANILVVDNQNNIAKNTADIEYLMSADMAALVIMPVDSQAVAPAVEEVLASGIPVVALNRGVQGVEADGVTHVWLGTDNYHAGAALGEHFMSLVDEGANIIILEGIPRTASGIDRLAGFMSIVENRVNIRASRPANFNRIDGFYVTEELLEMHPDVRYIVAMNDEMALGAISAVLEAGKVPGRDIFVTGFDGNDDARAAVAAGTMLFTVYQNPERMGHMGIEVALGLLRGETFPPIINIDVGFLMR